MTTRQTAETTATAPFAMSRRDMLRSLPALALARGLFSGRAHAQSAGLRPRALNHTTLAVSDQKRSLDFYQGLFGLPIQARQGNTLILRVGNGPQFIALSVAGANAPPRIDHYCLTVDGFDVERILAVLAAHGVTRVEAGAPGAGLAGGAMKVRVRMRGAEAGGAKEGTPEIYVGDPDGIVVQLQDPRYCGGAGVLGEVCSSVEPSPKQGLIAVRDFNHFTISVADSQRSNAFYQKLFGFGIQAYQGPTAPLLGVGDGRQFLMFAGGGGGRGVASAESTPRAGGPAPAAAAAAARRPEIGHVCLNMDNFNPDRVLKALDSFGLKPRGGASGRPAPMTHYVTMRMENRGGAPATGTPELYFTDPDGLLIQLQDVKYCGGGGYLGDACS
jgi:catechol 2,3-dioxygenase-like lactoylglutathione lyase family enzyme